VRTLGEAGHLARRFWWTLRATPPSAEDDAWACAQLAPAQAALWRAQHGLDRRHTVAVARRVLDAAASADVAAAGGPPSWLVEAALLHDVGKAEARLGVAGRTVATVLELVGVRTAPGAVGRYLRYTERGAELLSGSGARPEVVAWAREHHEPPTRWTLDPRWAGLLAAADHASG
jgi:putative nucleotidyltransferase with HDIG domain